jgi:type I restriction enzyme R subunit
VAKIIMTGSAADGPDWQRHTRNKQRRRALATRFKDPKDPFRIVIVRDMWPTGLDAPCLHTMYLDAELLELLLRDEIKLRSKKNAVQGQLFSEKLKQTLNSYHNRATATQEIIEELIKLAKDLDAASKRGEDLGHNEDEVAFYDALASNDSGKNAMGDDKLKLIAGELIRQVRKSVTIDWQYREGARAKIRVLVKRILNRHGYPPDLQEEAVKTVLRQTELLCAEWI